MLRRHRNHSWRCICRRQCGEERAKRAEKKDNKYNARNEDMSFQGAARKTQEVIKNAVERKQAKTENMEIVLNGLGKALCSL